MSEFSVLIVELCNMSHLLVFNFNNWCTDMSTVKFVIHSFHNKNYVVIIIVTITTTYC
jgi:hypothetical protein